MAEKIYLIPQKEILSDTGFVWESILFHKGWNDLPQDEKRLEVLGMFELNDGGYKVFDLFCKALNIEVKNVFTDEVRLQTEEKSEEII